MLRFASARSPLGVLLLAAPAWVLAGCSVNRIAEDPTRQPDAGMENCVDDTMCDDGIGCTVDRCEVQGAGRRCVHVRDNRLCAGAVPAGDLCRTAVCRPSEDTFDGTPDGCILVDRPDGTPCDDRTYCNGADHCQDGECVPVEGPGYVRTCGNGQPCNTTIDTCGCSVDADCGSESGKPRCATDTLQCVECLEDAHCTDPLRPRCDDDRTCKCLSDGDCDDGNPCTVDTCNEGTCGHDTSAAEGDSCTRTGGGSGYCDGLGNCVECLEATHCGERICPAWPRCDWSDTCAETATRSRTCQQPTCLGNRCGMVSDPETEPCRRDTDGRNCDDGLYCTETDLCVSGSCQGSGSPCSGSTPVCIEASDRCVECRSNTDCPMSTPVCDTATNTCVQCLGDADCPGSTPVCDTATNTCVQCLGDADCPGSTPFCVGNQCVECRGAADCDDSNDCTDDACSSGRCRHTDVARTTPCSGGYCDGVGTCRVCLNTTTGGADLGCSAPTPACRPFQGPSNLGVCVACTDDADCDDGVACTTDTCNTATNTCTFAPSDEACDDSKPCTVDTCDPMAGCQNSNSSPGTRCPGGVCDGSGRCVSCIDDSVNGTDTGCSPSTPHCVDGSCVE